MKKMKDLSLLMQVKNQFRAYFLGEAKHYGGKLAEYLYANQYNQITYIIKTTLQLMLFFYQDNFLPYDIKTLRIIYVDLFSSSKYKFMIFKFIRTPSPLFKALVSPFSTSSSLSYAKGPDYLNPINVSTGQLLLKMTEKYPQRIMLNSYQQNKSFTYEQMTSLAVKLALGMKKQFNLEPKDRIGIYSLNRWQWYIVQLAAALADLILVNINPSYRSEQLAYTIDKVRVKVLFISDSFKNSNYLDIMKQTVPQLKENISDPHNLTSKRFQFLQSVVRFNENDKKIKGFVNFSDLFHEKYSLDKLPVFPDVHDSTNIQFTSGTTGRPKAATLTHYNILNNGFTIGQRTGYTSEDNICVPVPLYHCFGMIMGNLAALVRGGSVTYVCQGFDPKKTLQALSKYNCTSLYGVPTMFSQYIRVYEENPTSYNITSLRTGIIAGSLAPQALMTKILNILKIKDITNCYGMTETSPVSFQTSPTDSFQNKTQSVGKILPGLEAKLIDSEGRTCQIGTPGQFLVKGWSVMKEYWQDPAANAKSIVDGWMKSGDLGVLDKQGYLSIVGRSKDMIIRGGENVYPKEIEEFLNNRLSNVMDVQVVSVPDEKYGEQIAAVIKVKSLELNEIKGDEIMRVCKNQIAHYKIPKYVMFVTEYPLTVTGKIQKYIIRNQLEEMKRNGEIQKFAIK